MRARNFSRRVTFFFPANSAWAKLLWWIMRGSLSNPRLVVCNKSNASGLNQRFLSGWPMSAVELKNTSFAAKFCRICGLK
jgi:hypothetical protein